MSKSAPSVGSVWNTGVRLVNIILLAYNLCSTQDFYGSCHGEESITLGKENIPALFCANRWRTFGHRVPPIVTERNLQISLLLEAGVGSPGAT